MPQPPSMADDPEDWCPRWAYGVCACPRMCDGEWRPVKVRVVKDTETGYVGDGEVWMEDE